MPVIVGNTTLLGSITGVNWSANTSGTVTANNVTATGGTNTLTNLVVEPTGTTQTPLTVEALASQSAPLVNVQNPNGGVMIQVGALGNLTCNGNSVIFGPLGTPVASIGSPTSGGTFTAGTYYWVVTATVASGAETVKSNEVTATLTTNQEVAISWVTVAGAYSYRIYRSTTSGTYGSTSKVAEVNYPATSYTDTGTATGTGTPTTTPTGNGLILQPWANQTTNPLSIKNAAGTVVTSVSTAGVVTGNGSGLTNLNLAATGNTGPVAIANGGTGQATANAAFNALVPSQTGNSGALLTTNGTNTSWTTSVPVTDLTGFTNLTSATPAMTDVVAGATSGGTNQSYAVNQLLGLARLAPGGRLTLTTGQPVTGSDVTGAATIYYTPYLHDMICLWDGTEWVWMQTGEINVSVAGIGLSPLTATTTNGTAVLTGISSTTGLVIGMPATGTNIGTNAVIKSVDSSSQVTLNVNSTASGSVSVSFYYPNYDVFAWKNGTSVNLYPVPWTDNLNRSTAISYQDGRLCQTGAKTYLFLGSFRLTAATTTEDSVKNRFVWNMYNRVNRPMHVYNSTASWTYSSNSAWEQANANTAMQVNFLNGDISGSGSTMVSMRLQVGVTNSAGYSVYAGIGLDTATPVNHYASIGGGSVANMTQTAMITYDEIVASGYHYLVWYELGGASGTTTWYGASINGLSGFIPA